MIRYLMRAAVAAMMLLAGPAFAADIVLSTGTQFLPGFRMVDGTDLNTVLTRVNGLSNGGYNLLNLAGTSSGKFLKWNVTADLLDLRGQSKFIYRPTTTGFGTQVKTEFTGTAIEHNALESTADWKANGAAGGGLRGLSGMARLDATYSLSSTADLLGVRGIIQNDGTIDGSGIHAAQYGLIEAGAGTWTAVSHLAAGWLDSHLTATPSSGSLDMLYMTNNGAATFADAFYIYGGNKVTNLFSLDTVSTMVTDGGAGTPGGTIKKIQITIDGTPYYVIASTGPT